MKTLGILIPYHNEREMLTQCLLSLESQKPDEILIFDDASKTRAEDFIPSSINAKVIRSSKNVGPSQGRNTLLKNASSDYIHFHDADDLFCPQWENEVRSVIEKKDVDMVLTDFSSCDEKGSIQVENLLGRQNENEDMVSFCIRRFVLPICSTLKRNWVLESGGYPEQFIQAEDYYFHVHLASRSKVFEVIPTSLVLKRNSNTNRSRDRVDVFRCMYDCLELLSKELPSSYFRDLAEMGARVGTTQFLIQDRARARQTFKLAKRLGPPKFLGRPKMFRLLARFLGQEFAEWFGVFYRNFNLNFIQKKRIHKFR